MIIQSLNNSKSFLHWVKKKTQNIIKYYIYLHLLDVCCMFVQVIKNLNLNPSQSFVNVVDMWRIYHNVKFQKQFD